VEQPVRIWYKKAWRVIEEHPLMSSPVLHAHIRGSFGEAVSRDLDRHRRAFFEMNGHRFFLRFLGDKEGGSLLIERLEALPDPNHWPKAVHDWFAVGGFLEVDREELYASILKQWTHEKTGVGISLEKCIKYPIPPLNGLLQQREQGEHFTGLGRALKEALDLHPQLLAFNQMPFTDTEKGQLQNLAKSLPVLCCQSSDTPYLA